MNDYEEKKQRKIDRYKELAEKAKQNSEQRYQDSSNILKHIPMGQPILVGHHSEKRHRGDIDRADNHMRKSIEADDKAEYYEKLYKGIENNNSISSDDPEAIQKLIKNLEKRIELQRRMKETNKKAKKEDKPRVHESWELSNNNANINRIRNRIELLKSRNDDVTKVIYEDDNYKILDNVEDNKLQIFFPGIPEQEIRTKLKRNGFRWSRNNGCWQRFRSNTAFNYRIGKNDFRSRTK